jgi:hypothetical protein
MKLSFQRQQHSRHNPPAVPMQVYNGLVTYDNDRRPWSEDKDNRPTQFRRYIMTGLQDVQLISGIPGKRYTGLLVNPAFFMVNSDVPEAAGWLTVYQTPRNPGAASYPPSGTGGVQGGFHFRGMDPLSYNAVFRAGPGSQPANPGGPGKVAADFIQNPMTG